jgi:uncharacterized membrane protein
MSGVTPGVGSRLPRLLRSEPLLIAMVMLGGVGYALYGVWEHDHFLTDFDLSIADQTVWHYSNLEAPRVTMLVAPKDALGDHFAALLAALAPLYWMWSDARVLLITQGALIAASFVPVFLFARPRIGRVGAYLLLGAYALFWGISAAVGFQFHELAFTPLLISCCVLAADREKWPGFWISLGMLLLVKENMSLLAVFIGLWLITGGQPRRGAIAIAAGVAWYFLTTAVLIPAFSGGAEYSHWTYTAFGPNASQAVKNIVLHPDLPVRELFNDPQKRRTLALLFLPFLLLPFGSRLIILSVPLIAQELWSNYPAQWGTEYHYWLPMAPVLAMATADGLANLLRAIGREGSRALAGTAVGAACLIAAVLLAVREDWVGNHYDIQLTGVPALAELRPGFSLAATDEDAVRNEVVARIPPGASTTVPAPLLPHMSHRRDIFMLGYPSPVTQYVAFNPAVLFFPDPAYAQHWLDQHRRRYQTIFQRDGWTIWRLRPPAETGPPRLAP